MNATPILQPSRLEIPTKVRTNVLYCLERCDQRQTSKTERVKHTEKRTSKDYRFDPGSPFEAIDSADFSGPTATNYQKTESQATRQVLFLIPSSRILTSPWEGLTWGFLPQHNGFLFCGCFSCFSGAINLLLQLILLCFWLLWDLEVTLLAIIPSSISSSDIRRDFGHRAGCSYLRFLSS